MRQIKKAQIYWQQLLHGSGKTAVLVERIIQKIIRDKNVPAWNGWDKVSDVYSGEEWFLMELEYDSEERIYATGQSYPENYDAVKDEILRKFIKYIEENKEFFIPYNEYNQE